MRRGDVVLVRFPHPSRLRGKQRPAVIVQSDAYAGVVSTLVVAEVTKNWPRRDHAACGEHSRVWRGDRLAAKSAEGQSLTNAKLTVRCGTCYRCFNCGNSMGCS